MMDNNTLLLIDKSYRGNLNVSLLVIRKIVSYALRDMTEQFFGDQIKCRIYEDNFLHIFVSGKVLQAENLPVLAQELYDAIKKELDYTLKIKPKNININFHH